MAYKTLLIASSRRFGSSRQALAVGAGLLGAWGIYSYWRYVRISHDARLAEQHCMSLAADFAACTKGSDPQLCRVPLLKLHNCIYRQKPYGQLDFDLL